MIHEPIFAWSTILLSIAGLIMPPRLDFAWSKHASFIPLAGLACFIAYELTNDPTYNIRADLLFLLPPLGASLLAMAIRIAVLNRRGQLGRD